MFELVWTEQAAEDFAAMGAAAATKAGKRGKSSRAAGLLKQVQKALALLQSNPRHPGLATHEYHSLEHPYDARQKVFEADVQNNTPGAYRIFWCYGPAKGRITILAITPHP